MKRGAGILLALLLVGAIYFARIWASTGTINYQGHTFKTAKRYLSYESYKDDPNNLDTNELERIEKVMIEARISASFDSRKEFSHTMFDLKFPGYGLGGIGEQPQADDGSKLTVESVEIPQREKERYVVVRGSGARLIVVDDFVHGTATNGIRHVKLERGKLRYYDDKGSLVRERQL